MPLIGLAVVLTLNLTLAPLAAEAQPGARMARIGYLFVAPAEGDKMWVAAFRQGPREHGYVEGENVVIEVRHAAQRLERLPELAARTHTTPPNPPRRVSSVTGSPLGSDVRGPHHRGQPRVGGEE